jgi:hypothetical protein
VSAVPCPSQLEEAEGCLQTTVDGLSGKGKKIGSGANREDTLNARGALAMVMRRRKKDAEAEALLTDNLGRCRLYLGIGPRLRSNLTIPGPLF